MKAPLLQFTSVGIYCKQGNFYIDPWQPVSTALITHAHGDHARWGHHNYIAHNLTIPFLVYRYNSPGANFTGLNYGEKINLNGVTVSFHPAGHIIGSSQIRVEYKGEVWVASGDYKLESDGISTPFEPISCHTFITESTFGLPCFQWRPQSEIFEEINSWWKENKAKGLNSVLLGYSLGKAQRLLNGLDPSIGPIFAHGAIYNLTELIRPYFPQLPVIERTEKEFAKQKGCMVLAPPSASNSPWLKRFLPLRLGYASGWMALRGVRRRIGADRGFVLSDHADWPSLQKAIALTQAEQVIVTHGFTHPFALWLRENGYQARAAKTAYGGEEEENEQLEQAENL